MKKLANPLPNVSLHFLIGIPFYGLVLGLVGLVKSRKKVYKKNCFGVKLVQIQGTYIHSLIAESISGLFQFIEKLKIFGKFFLIVRSLGGPDYIRTL